jgi:hypothetical protein
LNSTEEQETNLSFYVTNKIGNGGGFHCGGKPYKPSKKYYATAVLSTESLNIKSCEIADSSNELNRE